jgi:hypothetical protein
MQPSMVAAFGAERQQWVVSVFGVAAAEATSRMRAHRIAIEPLDHAAGEGARLGFGARQAPVELGDPRPLVEERQPVLTRPAT